MELKILIVDDEQIFCDGLSRILVNKGYSVDYATDGENALKKIKEKEYDITLLDINLPGKSGIELLPEIKSASSENMTIMVTACNDVSLAVKSIKAGAYDYFIKSSNYDELLIKVEKALEIQKLRNDTKRLKDSQ